MGLFDQFEFPGTPADGAQVKCFDCSLTQFKVGDEMPWPGEYAIALREGGYAVIEDGKLQGWQPEVPAGRRIYDKWGAYWQGNEFNTGLLGEDYLL